ncbi:SepM family pheromone-processing serine protease [Paenibacillus sp. GD4]|uniref:SepM family pheromone-processing serine protease n=1 Tax=Paenibacillus sp. GD4 TaxID=3068890 RepID=UPI0027967297|nr:SepM family pheromone-processing serine protease [Paenibacillus sp. GD4]MDQ1913245.1 SepM family pheromone-processing serine protease [Paenibacillus sp. GD4]
MGEASHMKKASRIVFSVFIAISMLYLVYFLPLPLYIFKPGIVEVIRPMVQVKEGGTEDQGQFMLTTVSVRDATLFGYVASLFDPYDELRLKSELLKPGESEQDYYHRQEVVMQTSQADAMTAAYERLKIPYRISNDGVVIMQVYPDMPAAETLQAGDYIVKVGDSPITSREDLFAALKGKAIGDTVSISYKRKNITRTKDVQLGILPNADGTTPTKPEEQRAGLGIVPADVLSVKAESEDKQVTIRAGEIGGPSAGLMFSLEIANRLLPEDITKGYRIAGTGTIDKSGAVGVIGGIKHKVIAADKAGAEIFFAPKDYTSPDGQVVPNYTDAVQRAKEIGTKMKIVPVGTMEEAMNYLASLPPKSASASAVR